MAGSFVSRRLSEFIGVAMFAVALMWLISLASYNPSEPAWFFSTGTEIPPLNFGGRVGAFLAELSFQMLGYSAYLVPIVFVVTGWHYFWCRVPDAAYTKLVGAGLLFACVSAFLSLAFGSLKISGRELLAGGAVGKLFASFLSEYLNKTGSIILILTLLFLAIVLSTQFSFGRLFGAIFQMVRDRWAALLGSLRARREERRREQQRQEVLKKHLEKSGRDSKVAKPVVRTAGTESDDEDEDDEREAAIAARARAQSRPSTKEEAPKPSRAAAVVGAAAAALRAAATRPTPPAIKRPASKRAHTAPPRAGEAACRAEARRVRGAAARAARCAEGRAQGRRARTDGRRQAPRGEVPRVLGRRRGRADPSGTGRHHVRVQARRGRQVQQDHRPRRRPVPGHAGRVGADRSHPRQVDGRHPDSQPEPGADLPARTARVRGVPALHVEAHDRAGQDDSRRAVRQRSRDDAAPAHRRLHRHGQVGQRERDALEHSLPRVSRRRAVHHGRSEAARARHVRGHSAPAHAGRRRSEARRERAALGRARDGGPLQDAGRRRRPQHRAVQQEPQAGAGREQGPGPRRQGQRGEDAALHRRADRRARGPDDGRGERGRGVDRAPRADGPRRRHPPDPRDPASVGGRDHRAHQGESPRAHLVPRLVEDRLAHDPRRQRRGATARPRRHAVSAAGLVTIHPPPRPVHLRAGDGTTGELPAEAGPADLRRDDHRGGQTAPAPISTSRRTISTTRRRGSSSRAARRRSRTSSGACASASAARPGSWT